MASPLANGHPSTPPPSADAAPPPTARPEPDFPLTSLQDDGQSTRPRDVRLIHLVLSSLGIHSYQARVPLQLLDFAYRYTSSVLSDSLRLSAEGYNTQSAPTSKRGGANATAGEDGQITVTAIRQAIASRTGYTFQGALPKEFMLEQAAERNRMQLPKVERGYGVQLPPEKYCLTGVGWRVQDEWDSEEDVEMSGGGEVRGGACEVDEKMGGLEEAGEDDNEEGAGRMEDVFGEEGGDDASMTQD